MKLNIFIQTLFIGFHHAASVDCNVFLSYIFSWKLLLCCDTGTV
jgi:hypothetical protein